ncbi:MAG: fimbrillin family protein [Alistipes sp.]|nr:fimbrillin family protein [Alistipes sp.]
MKNIFLAVLPVLAVLAGCAPSEQGRLGSDPESGDRVEVSLAASIEGSVDVAGGGAGPATRVNGAGNAWTGDERLGVFMIDPSADYDYPEFGYNEMMHDNLLYTVATNNVMTPGEGTPTMYYPQSGTVDLVAYYPYDDGWRQGSGTNQIDISTDVMWAKATGKSKSEAPVPLQFSHVMSKITLNVKAGEGVNSVDIDNLRNALGSVQMTMPDQAKLYLRDGSMDQKGSGTFFLKSTEVPGGFQAGFSTLVIPHTGAEFPNRAVEFRVGLPSTTYRWNIPSSANFEGGKHYIYNVTVSMTGITVGGMTIADWTVGYGGGDNLAGSGEAEIYVPSYGVGDVYPDPLSGKPAIGIIYELDASGKSGKIVAFDEGPEAGWSYDFSSQIQVASYSDGTENMKRVQYLGLFDRMEHFKWADRKNSPDGATNNTVEYENNQVGVWYHPARNELKALYAAWNGSTGTTANQSARDAFNKKLRDAGGDPIEDRIYWSSDEYGATDAVSVNFTTGEHSYVAKNTYFRSRAIMRFTVL